MRGGKERERVGIHNRGRTDARPPNATQDVPSLPRLHQILLLPDLRGPFLPRSRLLRSRLRTISAPEAVFLNLSAKHRGLARCDGAYFTRERRAHGSVERLPVLFSVSTWTTVRHRAVSRVSRHEMALRSETHFAFEVSLQVPICFLRLDICQVLCERA